MMPDDISQQIAQNAPALGTGSIVGTLLTLIAAVKYFATQKDLDSVKAEAAKNIDLAKAQMMADVAEKYAHKDDLAKMGDDISYIRQRIDQIADHK